MLLADQDRSHWNLAMVQDANRVLASTTEMMRAGPFQLQALIAAHHANARTAADTDWRTIVLVYEQLRQIDPSPIVRLNHAVAVSMVEGSQAALELLHPIVGLENYHLFHAARGELLLGAGDGIGAASAFARARELTARPGERQHLDRRIAASAGVRAVRNPG